MIRLSVVIITKNEERHIRRCLESVREIADDVVVVDSGSTDGTEAICRELGARFLTRPFDGFTTQKNFALDQAAFDHVLSLDADESLSPELARSIAAAKRDWPADGFTMNRLNAYGARWIRRCGWYPDRKLRLWDRRRGRWEGGLLHEEVRLAAGARTAHLRGDLLHRAYERADQLLSKMQSYSEAWARDHAHRKRVSAATILLKSVVAFLKAYLLRGGILDGYEGLVVSASLANGVLYKYAKLLEANRRLSTSLVITTYNRKDALELVLRSALAQIEPADEIIVADDGSREDTRELVLALAAGAAVPVRHCWHEDRGFRLAEIRNRAIAMARGDYVIMVDGDLVLAPEFVRDHRRAARRGRWVQGGRVMLGEETTRDALQRGRIAFGPFGRGTRNRKNAIRSVLLSRLASHKSDAVYRVRGANLAFWRDDVVRVNGFCEDFVGWGREDSEFAARMLHAGIARLHLKFAAVGYHLWHPEAARQMLERNQEILERTLASRASRCENGLDRHLRGEPDAPPASSATRA
jgi:glycosyltransferase involved in cell wall biosynthesis